ncbi:MAG: PEP-CTERM sorting domain-containing protein [Phycisphaerae bacterium]
MTFHSSVVVCAAGAAFAFVPAALAQNAGFGSDRAEILHIAGDQAPPQLGNPDFVYATKSMVRVNNSGDYVFGATINGAANFNNVLVNSSNDLIVRQGLEVPEIPGAFYNRVDDMALANDGTLAHTHGLFLQPRPGDSALFLDGRLMLQAGAPINAPGAEGFSYYRLDAAGGVQINQKNQILLYATIYDPTVPLTFDRGLIRLDYNRETLAYTETLVARTGTPMSGGDGQTLLGESIFTSNSQLAFNDLGQTMYAASKFGASLTRDFVAIDTQILAQEGQPSLLPGRNYSVLQGSVVALNNSGSWAYTGIVDGAGSAADRTYIARDGEIFVKGGDVVDGFTLGAMSGRPIQLSDNGDILWSSQLQGLTTLTNDAIFFNDKVLVKQGDVIDGRVLAGLAVSQDGYRMSEDGRWFIGRGTFRNEANPALFDQFVFRIAIPEPSSLTLLAGAALGLIRRRRKGF